MEYLDYPSFVLGGACGVLVFVVVPWIIGKALDVPDRRISTDN